MLIEFLITLTVSFIFLIVSIAIIQTNAQKQNNININSHISKTENFTPSKLTIFASPTVGPGSIFGIDVCHTNSTVYIMSIDHIYALYTISFSNKWEPLYYDDDEPYTQIAAVDEYLYTSKTGCGTIMSTRKLNTQWETIQYPFMYNFGDILLSTSQYLYTSGNNNNGVNTIICIKGTDIHFILSNSDNITLGSLCGVYDNMIFVSSSTSNDIIYMYEDMVYKRSLYTKKNNRKRSYSRTLVHYLYCILVYEKYIEIYSLLNMKQSQKISFQVPIQSIDIQDNMTALIHTEKKVYLYKYHQSIELFKIETILYKKHNNARYAIINQNLIHTDPLEFNAVGKCDIIPYFFLTQYKNKSRWQHREKSILKHY